MSSSRRCLSLDGASARRSNLEHSRLFHDESQDQVVEDSGDNPAGAENFRGTIHFEEYVQNDAQSNQRKYDVAQPVAAVLAMEEMIDHGEMQQHEAGQRTKIHHPAEIIQAVGKE